MEGISVILCCYNSSRRLPKTLEYLAKQKVDGFLWEVIVVDNASTDNTSQVAYEEWTKYSLSSVPLIVVNELAAGLCYARHKGVTQAKYEYVIFCDDDNWLDERYLSVAFHVLNLDSAVGVVGGQSAPQTDGDYPYWFEEVKAAYVIGQQATVSGDISERGYVWGAGMAFRRKAFLKAFSKVPSLLTDRKGEALVSGGDSEICRRFLLMGYKLYYCSDLKFTHFIPQNRLTPSYKENLIKSFYASNDVLNKYSELININSNSSIKKIVFLLWSFVKLALGKLTMTNRWDVCREKRNIFFITGWNLKVDHHSVMIKELIRDRNL